MTENNYKPDQKLNSSKAEQQQSPIKEKMHRYNHDEMMVLRDAPLSRTRPAELSKEFDNEDGLFSPDKWLQYIWQREGVENRVKRPKIATASASGNGGLPHSSAATKMLNAIMEGTMNNSNNTNELDQQTVFSPQRRGFSSGVCRPASPSKAINDEDKPVKSRWKQGQINNGVDFKPAFQKTALEANSRSSRSGSSQNQSSASRTGTGSWSVVGSNKQHSWEKNRRTVDHRERNRGNSTNTDEALPEWMEEGPTSHLDLIELKGFDDDPHTDKKKRTKGKEVNCSKAANKTGAGGNHHEHVHPEPHADSNNRPHSASHHKRHSSGGDISRPTSRQTPVCSSSSVSHKELSHSPAPVRMIQASDLETSILKEQQEKLNKEKLTDGKTFDIFAALGIDPPTTSNDSSVSNKLPNSDAEFAAFILGLPANQIAKHGHGIENSSDIASIPTSQQQEPTTSRLSRFFAKKDENEQQQKVASSPPLTTTKNKSNESIQQLTKSQFDLSALQAQLQEQKVYPIGQRISSPPGTFQSFSQSQQQRPASAENQHSSRFQPSPVRNLFTPSNLQQQNKLSNMPFNATASPEFNAQQEALLQQMQANIGGGHFLPQQPSHIQLPQQFLDQFRKGTSPNIPPTGTLFPTPYGQRPSSAEHHPHQMLSSPIYQQQQRQSPIQQMPIPPSGTGGFFGGGGGGPGFSNQFQHLILQTARRMMPNPNMPPDQFCVRLAYMELCKDPKIHAQLVNNSGGGGSFGGAGGYQPPPMGIGSNSFPTGHPSAFPPPPQFFTGSGPPGGSHFPYHHGMTPHPHSMAPSPSLAQMHHSRLPHPHHFNSGMMNGMPPAAFQQQKNYPGFALPIVNQHSMMHQKHPSSSGFNPNHNLLNTPAFMPTSVMRQMSKLHGGASGSPMAVTGESSSNPQSMFLQKLFVDASARGGGRAILGCDLNAESPTKKEPVPPRVAGCMKLEDIEQRELAACQQQSTTAPAADSTNSVAPPPPPDSAKNPSPL